MICSTCHTWCTISKPACGVTGHCMHTACAQRAYSVHTAYTRQVLATLSYSFSAGMLGASRLLVQGSSRPLMKGCSGVGGGSRKTLKAVACMIQSGVSPMRSTCFSLSAAATLASPTWSSNLNLIRFFPNYFEFNSSDQGGTPFISKTKRIKSIRTELLHLASLKQLKSNPALLSPVLYSMTNDESLMAICLTGHLSSCYTNKYRLAVHLLLGTSCFLSLQQLNGR